MIILVSLILGTILVIGSFYWFQWRPSNIRKHCYNWSIERAREAAKLRLDIAPGEPSEFDEIIKREGFYNKDDKENYYKDCLQKEGLK